MNKLLWIGLAGAMGALARTALGQVVPEETSLSLATFGVNIVGSFLLCFITSGACHKLNASKDVKDAVTTGFLGSFTTFSALSLETILLMEDGHYVLAALYVLGSIVGGLVAGAFGFSVGRKRVDE